MKTGKSLVSFGIVSLVLVAMVNIAGSEGPPRTQPSRSELLYKLGPRYPIENLRQRWRLFGPSSISPENHFILSMRLDGGPGLTVEALPEMVDGSPRDALASDEIRQKLKTGKRVLIGSSQPRSPGFSAREVMRHDLGAAARPIRYYTVHILAPTPEEANELAQALIRVHNNWWSENRRKYLMGQIQERKERLAKVQGEFEKAEEQHRGDKALLKDLWPIGPDTRIELKTKQLLLKVDVAGVRAKLDEAQRLTVVLDEQQASPTQQDQLEIIKMKAQVDLAGLLAQQKQLSVMLEANVRLSRDEFGQAQWQRDEVESQIKLLQRERDTGKFRPLQVSGVPTVHPIDWEEEKGARDLRPGTLRK